MHIDGINTAMIPAQFGRARSLARTVETADSSSARHGGAGILPRQVPVAGVVVRPGAARPDVLPASFHCTYQMVMGKPAAKRRPPIADSSLWSISLNRVG